MSRQMLDAAIILAVLVLVGAQLYAQGFGSRRVVLANPSSGTTASAARAIKEPDGGAAVGARGATADGHRTGTCTITPGQVVSCAK